MEVSYRYLFSLSYVYFFIHVKTSMLIELAFTCYLL